VTVIGQAVFPKQANGSLIIKHGEPVGSTLLGQTFAKPLSHPEYFWGRASAASVSDAGLVTSGGSNYGPRSDTLADEVKARIADLRTSGASGTIPVDLVTKSGSGLDPHISPASALIQAPRVARARGLPEETIEALIATHTEAPTFGFLGDARVNVLTLNLALDARSEDHR
jgi:K+-transporting ATPase ATPase C chain